MARYPEKVADTLLQGMRLGLNNSMNGFAYEPQISYVAAKVHGHRDKFTSLGNLYQFHKEVAFLAKLQVQLVAMFRGPDGKWRATQAGPGFGPSPQMGFKANSPKELLEHLKDGGATCIINPDVFHGGDHIKFYKVKGSKHYIMVVDQAKLSAGKDGKLRPEMLEKALQANDPRRYYKPKVRIPFVFIFALVLVPARQNFSYLRSKYSGFIKEEEVARQGGQGDPRMS